MKCYIIYIYIVLNISKDNPSAVTPCTNLLLSSKVLEKIGGLLASDRPAGYLIKLTDRNVDLYPQFFLELITTQFGIAFVHGVTGNYPYIILLHAMLQVVCKAYLKRTC